MLTTHSTATGAPASTPPTKSPSCSGRRQRPVNTEATVRAGPLAAPCLIRGRLPLMPSVVVVDYN